MKLDEVSLTLDPPRAATAAARAERLGLGALWTGETQHDPFLPLAVAAAGSSSIRLGTAIATAFTRSPMVTAMIAWDLQAASGGRFTLGLGTQVKGHNERRFSVPFERPAPRLRELVLALRHVWGAFQGEHPLDWRGEFYRMDLLTPFFDPGPIAHPRIPIFLAAVTPLMYRIAGEVADGVHVHPFHTPRYLREVALPALARGLDGRTRSEVELAAPVLVVVGSSAERAEAERFARLQIAFYGSTRIYRPVLDLHGFGELSEQAYRLVARGRIDELVELVTPEVLREFAVEAETWDDAAHAIRKRYDGLLDRVSLSTPPNPPDDAALSRMVRILAG